MPDPTADPSQAPLRADAQANRDKVLQAARQMYATHGLEVSMAQIAKAAGVGLATLLRRFPTREDLIASTFTMKITEYAALVTDALKDPDPWHGFCWYVEQVCSMQAEDRGFTEVLVQRFPQAAEFEAERDRGHADFVRLIANAKRDGQLRDDFVAEDFVLLLMAMSGVMAATHTHAPSAWRRILGYFLQACRADNDEPLPAPPTPRETFRSLNRSPHTCGTAERDQLR